MDCPTDIIFVVDESGSIGSDNYDLMKDFLSQLVSRLDIDSGSTRVGLVTFHEAVGEHFNLSTYTSVALVQNATRSLRYGGGATYTFNALEYVRTTMLTSAAGDRPKVPNVVVILTDGQSNNSTLTEVSTLYITCGLTCVLCSLLQEWYFKNTEIYAKTTRNFVVICLMH